VRHRFEQNRLGLSFPADVKERYPKNKQVDERNALKTLTIFEV
jgi:hypothetical protein